MFKKILLCACILFLVLSLLGCKDKKQSENTYLFQANKTYQIGFKGEKLETHGSFHFDDKGCLHFLHEDPLSPLFGMEEVLSTEGVITYFNGMQFNNSSYFGGIGSLYDCLNAICNSKPTEISKSGDTKTYHYKGEALSLDFVISSKSEAPIQIIAFVNGENLSIKFSSEA